VESLAQVQASLSRRNASMRPWNGDETRRPQGGSVSQSTATFPQSAAVRPMSGLA
jgi:hypothetical protein